MLKELIAQFFTSTCVLSAVIVISQLTRLSEVLVTFGISVENIFLPFLFLLMPFLAFIIPMAYLFAVVMTFTRLSADGEYTAMVANGYSLSRSAVPVVLLGSIFSIAAAVMATNLEAWGRRETVAFYQRKTETEIDNMIRFKMQPGVFLDNFLGYVLYAEKISADKTRFENVLLGPGGGKDEQSFTLMAPSATLLGSVAVGELKMAFENGLIYASKAATPSASVIKFQRAELDILKIFQDQIFGSDSIKDDYRSYRPLQLWDHIERLRQDIIREPARAEYRDDYAKARYLFHKRIGMPFTALIFALYGMVLGIHDERRGKSYGFLGSILTIMVSYISLMMFQWLAEKGYVNAVIAVWLPNILLAAFGLFLVYQRNRLPPSESPLDPKLMPRFSEILAKIR